MEWNPQRANYEIIDGQISVCKHGHEKGDGCRYEPLAAAELSALLEHYRMSLSKIAYCGSEWSRNDVREFAEERLNSFEFSPNAQISGGTASAESYC